MIDFDVTCFSLMTRDMELYVDSTTVTATSIEKGKIESFHHTWMAPELLRQIINTRHSSSIHGSEPTEFFQFENTECDGEQDKCVLFKLLEL